ncbi:hypothetical protein PFISCL1PPCAC_14722, partial [Pristionchus fissidentatus]
NERGMEFSIVMGMMLMWTDPRMRWNPLKYNNISHFYLTLDQIWFPHFHPCTSSAVTYLSIDRNQAVKIFSNGEVKTILRAEITFSCAFNTERFPFDVQQCYLCFTLNGYDPEEVRFTAYMDEGALTNEMSEWRVQIDNKTFSFPYCANDICMTIMQYPVVLSRNPQFWIGLVVIPIFMLGFLIFIGLFFSGPENLVNNAIGFGLTTMTSMMVVVGILNDSLSKIERIPCMGLFVLIQISVTSIAVISVLLTDQIVRKLSKMAKSKSRDNSRVWRVVEKVSSGGIVRNTLFIVFTILHIANFIWFVSNK